MIGDTTMYAKRTLNNSSTPTVPTPTSTEGPPITPTTKPSFNEKVNIDVNKVIKLLVEEANGTAAEHLMMYLQVLQMLKQSSLELSVYDG